LILAQLKKIPNEFYIAALRLEDGSLLVIATQTAPKSAIADYAKRWGIETLRTHFQNSWFLSGINSSD
jgi:hypothetical protein